MGLIARFCTVVFMVIGSCASAQDDGTLADIRQELTVLHVEMQKLKRELSTTSGAADLSGAGSVLERVNAIEAALQRLTGKTEELEFRIARVVKDGTNRIGDLEFRLVELEGGDVGQLGETSTLGGAQSNTASPSGATSHQTDTSELAVGEEADFKAAQAAFAAGDHGVAAQKFASFSENYPGSPMEARAKLLLGEALEAAGELTKAARAYLAAFSRDPEGADAPMALYHLGNALGRLGQSKEACVTLAEVEGRFPTAQAVLEAKSAMRNLGCS